MMERDLAEIAEIIEVPSSMPVESLGFALVVVGALVLGVCALMGLDRLIGGGLYRALCRLDGLIQAAYDRTAVRWALVIAGAIGAIVLGLMMVIR